MSSFDDFINIQQRINTIYNPILQSVNTNAFNVAGNALIGSMFNIPAIQISNEIQESLVNFGGSIRDFMNYDHFNIASLSESMQTIIESEQPYMRGVNADISLFMQNYTDMIFNLNSMGYHLSDLLQQACDEIDNEEFIEEDFSTNEEILEALQEQADDPKGFQEKVADWSEAKKKKYYILIGIIFFIWTNIFQPYFQENIGKPVATYTMSKVKEFPKAAGKIIDELKKDFQATITEDVPYYYKVKYTDENGNIREGYVAKKNLKIIEVEDDTKNEVADGYDKEK